jgi:hypothetical protein
MHKAIIALVAATTIGAATLAPTDAFAQRRGAVAAGILGGLAAGAIVGGAIANSYPPPGYYYAPAPVYAPPPAYYVEPACHVEGRRVWDGYAWRYQRVTVCD